MGRGDNTVLEAEAYVFSPRLAEDFKPPFYFLNSVSIFFKFGFRGQRKSRFYQQEKQNMLFEPTGLDLGERMLPRESNVYIKTIKRKTRRQ